MVEGPRSSPTIPRTQLMLGFAVGCPLAHQLGVEAIPFSQLAPHQAHVLHRAGQPVDLHRVTRIQERRQHQPVPFHLGPAPAEAARIGLTLYRVQLVSALEPDPAGAAQE